MAKIIPLTRGYETIVDDEDYDWLMQWKWRAWTGAACRTEYAVREGTKADGSFKGRTLSLHRVILRLEHAGKSVIVDHKDLNGLNNLRNNLRITDKYGNARNKASHLNSSSVYRGVTWVHTRWIAQLRVNGRLIRLGKFKNEKDAALAYDIAAKRYFQEFATLNFPEGGS